MDSCNSGSLQSSSGGDEEYDSRAAISHSAFMPTQPTNPLPPPPMFDPLSQYFLNNPNMPWPRPVTPRSNPNNNTMNNLISSFQPQSVVGAEHNINNLTPASATPGNQNQTAARNPKKRSRASRRAPTTVLTTDTTNFRAMVQEFTGIPAPPFSNSPFQRTRLDLLGLRSNSLDAPPYLLRPFAQKVQPPPQSTFGGGSTALDAIGASSTTNNSSSLTGAELSNEQLSSIWLSEKKNSNTAANNPQSSNLFNVLSPFTQTNSRFPFSDSSHEMGSKNQFGNVLSDDHHNSTVKIGGFDDLGLSRHVNPVRYHGTTSQHVNNQISAPNDHNKNDNEGSWRNNPVRNRESDHHQAQVVNGNYEFSRNTMANFNGEKGSENVGGSRGEGMIESWINCSNSDQ